MPVSPAIYFPGTTDAANAQWLKLAAGEERTGVDLQRQVVPAVCVSGTLMGPDGPVASSTVRLRSATSAFAADPLVPIEAATSVSDATGTFTFIGVPPGPLRTDDRMDGSAAGRTAHVAAGPVGQRIDHRPGSEPQRRHRQSSIGPARERPVGILGFDPAAGWRAGDAGIGVFASSGGGGLDGRSAGGAALDASGRSARVRFLVDRTSCM